MPFIHWKSRVNSMPFRSVSLSMEYDRLRGKTKRRTKLCAAHHERRKPERHDAECTRCRRDQIAASVRRLKAARP